MSLLRCALLFPLLVFGVGCSRSTANWAEELKSADSAQRLHAVLTLQKRTNEPKTVVPLLIQTLGDEDVFVRRDAARGLGHFGVAAQPAIPALRMLLRDPEPSVRKAAQQALVKIDPNTETNAVAKADPR